MSAPTLEDGLLARLSASAGRNIDLLKRVQAAEAQVTAVRELHQPKRITEYNVPVFDEYDPPTVTHSGCACGSHYYPCNTLRVLVPTL